MLSKSNMKTLKTIPFQTNSQDQ